MKFVYTYRQSIALAVYISLLTGIAAPAMARPVSGNAAVRAVAASTVAQSGNISRPRRGAQRGVSSPTGFVVPNRAKAADEKSGKLIPDGVTLRSTAGVKGFERAERTRVQVGGANGSNVQEQVVDITNFVSRTRTPNITASPLSDEIDPYWTADEQFIFFASNRDAFGGAPAGQGDSFDGTPDNYQLYRIVSNPSPGSAGQLARLTNEPGAIHRFPTVSTSNRLAFVKSIAGTSDFQLYTSAIPAGVIETTPAPAIGGVTIPTNITSLTAGRQIAGRNILRVGRPAWLNGTEVVFSADLSDGQSDVLVVNVQSGLIRNLTNSTASEANVAVSPGGTVVAFDSNASGYNFAAPAASIGVAANGVRNVFVMSNTGADAVQVTGGTGSGVAGNVSSVQPAWTRSAVTPPPVSTQNTSYLAFASNRQPAPTGGGFVATANGSKDIYYLAALTGTQSGAPGLLIEGSNFPAVATPTYSGVATGSVIKLDTGDLQPNNQYRWDDQYPTFPPLLNALRIGFQSNRKGNTLNRDAAGIETLNVFSPPNPDPTVTPYPIPGSGPNRNDLFIASIIDLFAPTLLRYDLSSPTGEVVHINLGTTFQPGTGASVRNRSQGLTPGSNVFFTVRGEDLESGIGSAYIQIKNPNSKYQSQAQGGDGVEHKEYSPSAFAIYEVSGQFLQGLWWQPNNRSDLNVGQEYECQVIGASDYLYYSHSLIGANIYQTGAARVPSNAPGGMYDAGGGIFDIEIPSGINNLGTNAVGVGDDGIAFSGSAFPPPLDAAGRNIWLPLQRIDRISAELAQRYPGGRDGQGGVLYGATWRTPAEQSDWFMDVIFYDNAINPFDPNGSNGNWIIYDNVWGFSTAPSFNAQPVDVLVVSDYMLGQKFLAGRLNRRQTAGQSTQPEDNLPNIIFGGESYITDSDVNRFPDGLPAAPVFAVPASTMPVLRQWEIGGPFLTGLVTTPSPFSPGNGGTPNPLGVASYIDNLLIGDSVVADTGTDGLPRFLPSVGRYNIWRTLSRGPVPASLLTDYLPFQTTAPPDAKPPADGRARTVLNASRMVIWASPFAQTVFRGAGTITDIQTQQDLTNFANQGGRFMLSGQDVAFALSGNGQANSFVNNVLGVAFSNNNAGGAFQLTFNAPATSPTPTDIDSVREVLFANRIGRDSLGPGVNSAFQLATGTGRGYSPPGSEALDLQNFPDLLPPADYRGSASGIASARAGSPLFLGFNDVVTAQGATPIYGFGGGGGLFVNVVGTGPTAGAAVFASFGFESLTEGFYTYTPAQPPMSPPVLAWRGRRSEIMHNITDALRTATVTGRVIDDNNSPVTDALIRVTNNALQTDPAVGAQGTALTDADGNYQVTGLIGGFVTVEAFRQGFYTQVSAGNVVHGGSRATVNLTVKRAGPGQLSGIQNTNVPPTPKVRGTGTNTRVVGGVFQSDDVTPIPNIPVLAYYAQASATQVRYIGFITVTSDGTQRDASGALIPAGQYVFPQDLPIGNYQLVANTTRVVDPATGQLVPNTGQLTATINGQDVTVPAANGVFSTDVYVTRALSGRNGPGVTGIDVIADNTGTPQNEETLIVVNDPKTANLPGDFITIEENKRAGVDFRLSAGEQRITGQVRQQNADGTPGAGIRGATVTITVSGSGTVVGQTISGDNGEFVLTYNATTPDDPADDRASFPENNYTVAVTSANGFDLTAQPAGLSLRPSVNIRVGGDTNVVVQITEPRDDANPLVKPGALLLAQLPPGSVSGLVTRVPGSIPTEGATVRLYNADVAGNRLDGDADAANGITPAFTTLTTTAQTENGYRFNYRLGTVSTGSYVADVELRGFSPSPTISARFTVTSGNETRNINFTLESPKIYGTGVQLVSIPLDYSQTPANADPRLIFGLRDGADNNGDGSVNAFDQTLFSTFNIAEWAGGPDYKKGPTIPLGRGKGYFVRFGGATAVTNADGVAGTGNEFVVNLLPGWNLIGNPFVRVDNPFALPPDIDLSVGTRYTGADGVEVSYNDAITRNLVRGVAYGYTGENSNSQYFQSSVLKPYLGYWFLNASTTTVQMKFLRPTEGAVTRGVQPGRNSKPLTRAEQEKLRFRSINSKNVLDWRLQLAVKQGELLDTDNAIGIAPTAKDGYDNRFDTEKPPVMTAAPMVYLSIDGVNAGGSRAALADDIRDGSQVGVSKRSWNVSVQPAEGKGDVTVFWPNVNRLPRGVEPFLVDDATGKRIPMRSASSYTYTPSSADGGRAVHKFRVEVAKPSSVPLMLTNVRQTRVTGRGVGQNGYRVGFRVTREADVTMEVQTLTGRTLSTVVTRARGGADGSLFWNGRAEAGYDLPAGAYVLTVTAKDSEGSVVQVRQPILSLR